MENLIEKTVYHGSDRTIRLSDVSFADRRDNCDFGKGFYVTENKQVAEEWVCNKTAPVMNVFKLKVPESRVLHLTGRDWVAVVSYYREKIGSIAIVSNILRGTIADDRLDDSFSLFLDGVIGDLRLIKCLDQCKLGDQFCFRFNVDGLTDERSYELRGLELQKAAERFQSWRMSMEKELRQIRRQNIDGELFIEDYIKRGFNENKVEL